MTRRNPAVYQMAPGESAPRRGRGNRRPDGDVLTRRETDVMALVVKDYTRGEIANTLSLSPATVSMHLDNIYSKLNVHTHQEASAAALSAGLVTL